MGSEALIIISDDEDDVQTKPSKQKKRSLQIEEDVDVILIEEESAEHEEDGGVLADDDCCIIKYDGDDMRVAEHQVNEGDDLVVVGERGPVACRDYPHARHLCVKFPFKSTSHETHCDQCHCYVCDVLAPCLLWGQGKQKTDHCHAFEKDDTWREMRKRALSPPAKLKVVIRPQAMQSSLHIPNYQNRCHSPADPRGPNVNSVPVHAGPRNNIRRLQPADLRGSNVNGVPAYPGPRIIRRLQPIVLQPTSGRQLGSDFVPAPNVVEWHNRINITIPCRPVGMMNNSRPIHQPFLQNGTNIHTNTRAHNVRLEDSVPSDAAVSRHTVSPASISSGVPIFQEALHANVSKQSLEKPMVHGLNAIASRIVQKDIFSPASVSSSAPILQEALHANVSKQGLEHPMEGLNAIASRIVQKDEVNSSDRPILESLKRTSFSSERIERGEPRTIEAILPNNDGTTPIRTCQITNREEMQSSCSIMDISTANTGSLMTTDLFDLGILEDIFGNEQFQNLWDDMSFL